MKKQTKKISGVLLAGLTTLLVLAPVQMVYADTIFPDSATFMNISSTTGLGITSPIVIVALIIQGVLLLLGIIALVLIIYAGFMWMTARGNEEQVTKARGTLIAAVIGLAIILSSYSLAAYIFGVVETSTGYNYNGTPVQ